MKLRLARRGDVPAIVRLLADDQLGAQRERLEDPLPDVYWQAFDVIDGDPNNELVVADRAGKILACLQITYIPYLSRGGSWRAQIEAVRVSKSVRRGGIGRRIVEWAMARARDKNLYVGAANHRQAASGCPPVLRFTRVRCQSRGHEAAPGRALGCRPLPQPPAERAMRLQHDSLVC